MFLILVVGSCCGAYRTRKSNDDASFDGIESFGTATIQVNNYNKFLTLGSSKTLFGFTRCFFRLLPTSEALFKRIILRQIIDRSDRNFLLTVWTWHNVKSRLMIVSSFFLRLVIENCQGLGH